MSSDPGRNRLIDQLAACRASGKICSGFKTGSPPVGTFDESEAAVLDLHGHDPRATRSGMPVHLPTLHVRVDHNGPTPIVVLVGEVDLVDKQKLDDCLASLTGTVIVDLQAVTFLGSTGIRAFVVAQKRLCADGGKLLLRSPGDHIRRVLEITGLDFMVIGSARDDGSPAA